MHSNLCTSYHFECLLYRPLAYTKSPSPPSPYFIEPSGGYKNPPPPRQLDRSPSPSRKKRDPVITGILDDPTKDYRDYAQYGANPIIIGGGSKYQRRHPDQRNRSSRRDDRRDDRRDERRDPRRSDRRDRDPRRSDRRDDRRDNRRDSRSNERRERTSDRPPRRRDVDEASALGALNNVVRDLAESDSASGSGASSRS